MLEQLNRIFITKTRFVGYFNRFISTIATFAWLYVATLNNLCGVGIKLIALAVLAGSASSIFHYIELLVYLFGYILWNIIQTLSK
jgi:hypothetical protein